MMSSSGWYWGTGGVGGGEFSGIGVVARELFPSGVRLKLEFEAVFWFWFWFWFQFWSSEVGSGGGGTRDDEPSVLLGLGFDEARLADPETRRVDGLLLLLLLLLLLNFREEDVEPARSRDGFGERI